MQPLEIIQTDVSSVSCSGKEAPLDHPKVYLEIDPKKGYVDCPYCGKRFQLATANTNLKKTTAVAGSMNQESS